MFSLNPTHSEGFATLLRPPFALERIEQINEDRVVYCLPRPQRDGRTARFLTPLEFIDRLAALIPRRGCTATATMACWRPMRRCARPPPPTGAMRGPASPAATACGFTARCRGAQ